MISTNPYPRYEIAIHHNPSRMLRRWVVTLYAIEYRGNVTHRRIVNPKAIRGFTRSGTILAGQIAAQNDRNRITAAINAEVIPA